MSFPIVTAGYTAVLALVFMALSFWVIAGREKYQVMNGDGGVDVMVRRMRAHANFAEYVPLALLLMSFIEMAGTNRSVVHTLLAVLVVARIAHPVGMVAADGSTRQKLGRGMGILTTFAVIVVAAVLLLIRVL